MNVKVRTDAIHWWIKYMVWSEELYKFSHQSTNPLANPLWSCLLCMHTKSLQSYPILCDPMGCSSLDSSVHEILQARILEWVVLPSSRWSSWPRDQTIILSLLCVLSWQIGSIPPESPGKHHVTNILNKKCTPGLFGLSSIKNHQDLVRTEKFKQ